MSESDVKEVKELYIRNLSPEDSKEMKVLQVRFDEKTATGAAKKAIFGYTKLETKLKEERELTAHLRQIIKERDHTILSLKNSISRHFDLEVKQQESKGHLLGLVEEINKTAEQANRNVTL